MALSFTRSLSKGILNYLKLNMPSIVEAYDEFPNPSQKLKFPSFSLFLQEPNFIPTTNYVVSVGEALTSGIDINKSLVKRCVGNYDFTIQIDFWCENKFQKHDIYEEFIQAFNKNLNSGLRIQLSDYHNEWVQIDLRKVHFSIDNETSSQRSEWRFKVDVFGNSRCIKESLEYVMVNIESVIETES